MKTLSVDNALPEAVAALRQNGVIAAPTETVYGLMALWTSASAREKIYTLKHRPQNKLLQMLISSAEDLHAFNLKNQDWINAIGSQFWPGPLTLIVETEGGDTIGARVPGHPFIIKLIKELGAPIAATSANLSGEPPAANAADAVSHLDGQPDVLVDGGIVTITGGAASTVASIVGRKLAILRQGPVSLEELQKTVDNLR